MRGLQRDDAVAGPIHNQFLQLRTTAVGLPGKFRSQIGEGVLFDREPGLGKDTGNFGGHVPRALGIAADRCPLGVPFRKHAQLGAGR